MKGKKEIWKIIEEFNGRYEISNQGRVWSNIKNIIMKFCPDVQGYLYINFYSGVTPKKYKKMAISRLVLKYFGNWDSSLQANHINGVKTDNRIENLEMVTGSENQKHAVRIGLRKTGEGSPSAKLTFIEAEYIRHYCKGITNKNVGLMFGVSEATISLVRNNLTHKCEVSI